MALDTISLSDLGKSLVEIESEIKSNKSNIKYYQSMIGEMYDKNELLAELAKSLIKAAIPLSLAQGRDGI